MVRNFKKFKVETTINEVISLLKRSEQDIRFIIQITTKGNELNVIIDGLNSLERYFVNLDILIKKCISVEVLTEVSKDKEILEAQNMKLPLSVIVVPKTYMTSNNTKLKARALQYMVEQRNKLHQSLQNVYVIHFDSESTIKETALLSILGAVLKNRDKYIFQGPITYPNKWFSSNVFSRQMESLRPWVCYECYHFTKVGRPYHLHGSNLVIRADIEAKVTWDFGQIYNQPIIAEDLIFGLRAYLTYGEKIFGWHGGELYEQPALIIRDSLKQRIRWIRGTLQALSLVPSWSEYKNTSKWKRAEFKLRTNFKVFFYAFGFIPSTVTMFLLVMTVLKSIFKLILPMSLSMSSQNIGPNIDEYFMPMVPYWMVQISIIGLITWLLSVQIGLYHNIKPLKLSMLSRIKEHLAMLFITPFATFLDTGTIFFTILFWVFGSKKANWEVTTKSIKPKKDVPS